MRGILAVTVLGLAIAGCSGSEDAPAETPSAVESPMPVEPDGGIGDGAGPPQASAAIANDLIPERFRGVWDYVEGSCNRNSDLRMEISGDEILFYESIGRVADVEAEGDAVIVTLDMEGEGENWQEKTRFSLSQRDGQPILSASEGDKPAIVDEYPSKKCPA